MPPRREPGSTAPRIPRATRTPTEIGQTVPTSAAGERAKARALQRVSSGQRVTTVYPSGTAPAGGATTGSRVAAEVARVERQQRQQVRALKQQQRTIKKAIRSDPPKAAKVVERRSDKLWDRLDVRGKGPAPKIELGDKTRSVESRKPTVAISKVDARRYFSPKPAVRKAARAKVAREGVKAQTNRARIVGKREERIAAELKTAAKKARRTSAKVPADVPQELRKYVAKFGKKYVDPVAPPGVTGPEYLGRLLKFESGYQRDAVSSVGARDLGQFMPGTAETFRTQYGVNPVGGSAKDAVKGAAMHLSGDFGHPALYAGYNPGYSDTDPIPSVDAGPSVRVGKPRKPIPKQTIAKAERVLGEEKTKEIVKGKKAVSSEPKKLKGPYDGSREMVRRIVGTNVRGDKEEGHSSTGDHDPSQPNAYAQDINMATGNAAEHEPAYNQASLDEMVGNLRKLGADVPDLQMGENWEGSVKGYRIQILTAEHGTGPHFHVGARWEGTPTSIGATTAYSTPTTLVGSPVTSASSGRSIGNTSALATRQTRRKRRGRKLEGRERQRLLRELIAQGPADAETTDPNLPEYSSYARNREVEVSL